MATSKLSAASILSVALVLTCLTPSKALACSKWDLGRNLVINQGNGFKVNLFQIEQTGKKFDASARYERGRGEASGSIDRRGRFKLKIDWDHGSVGIYTAHVDEEGVVQDGRTFDEVHPANWSTWTTANLTCDEE